MNQKSKLKQTEIGKIPEDWEVKKIGDICNVKNGKTNSQDAAETEKFPLFDRSSQIILSEKYLFDSEAVIIPGEGKEFIPRYFNGKFDLHQRAYAITPKDKKILLKFVSYWVSDHKDYLARIAVGSTVKSLRLNHLTKFPIGLPPLSEQTAIAKILSDLDAKIELNNQMNKNLETIGQALFKRWFVDEKKNDWKEGKLGEIIENFDSKRVPLSSIERSKRKGKVPYYGATGIFDYIDDFLFDGEYILMGEDGSVVNENGTPVLQFVRGKFWANNHAHVLKAKDPFYNEFLYLLLASANVSSIVTGAVQPKINQLSMNNFSIILPGKKDLEYLKNQLKNIFEGIYKNNIQSNKLAQIRDSLLPKLMCGEVRLK